MKDSLVTPDVNKNDVMRGAGKLGRNNITRGLANKTGIPNNQKVNKAEEPTYLTINIGDTYTLTLHPDQILISKIGGYPSRAPYRSYYEGTG